MATCTEVITKAYRKLGARARSEILDPEELQEGMEALQSLYDEFVFSGTFGRVLAVQSATDIDASEGSRVFATVDDPIIVTYPDEVADELGLTVDNNGNRPPRDLSVISVAGGENYLYSHVRGAWDQISNLAMTDFAPLSERSLDGLACLLAVVVADEARSQVSQITAARATRFKGWVTHTGASEPTTQTAEYF